jgi:hypothetical protein
MIKNTHIDHVRACVQLPGNVNVPNLFPIAIWWNTNGGAVDFYFGATHRTNAQMRRRWPVRQSKLPPECCVEAGKPMRVRVDRRRKNYPLRPSIVPQEVDCRIFPRHPSQDRHSRAGKYDDPNCSMPPLENQHCDLNV